jgi:hypothetical protein
MVARADKVELADDRPGRVPRPERCSTWRACRSNAPVAATRGLDKMRLVGEAFMLRATQSTSDFATLLENTMNKVLQAQYAITPDTWRKFCNSSTNPTSARRTGTAGATSACSTR